MILRRLLPAEHATTIDLDSPDADIRLSELYRPPTAKWLRLNMVASVTGSAAGSDGTSNSLTSRVDRRLLGVIRGLADVILIGAESVRREGYQVPRTAKLAVVTGSGDLTGHRLSDAAAGRVLVLCPPRAVDTVIRTLDGAAAEVVPVEDADGRMPPGKLIGALRARRLDSIVCEGGPQLSAQLIWADLVDEFCLTTGPFLTGMTLPLFGGAHLEQRRMQLDQLLSDESGALYARWSVPGA